jgi:predicted RNase H-like nuclease (RuvC/YqgF family)
MKTFFYLLTLFISLTAYSTDYGYLKKEDQVYFKNDSFEGSNKWERIDKNVKEINKLHGEIATLKADIAELKKEVEMLKNKK